MIRVLKKQEGFNIEIKLGFFKLEDDINFMNSQMNIITKNTHSGFLELYKRQEMQDEWQNVFLILTEHLLLIFFAPQIYYYERYKYNRRKVQLYKMESYNLISDRNKIPLAKTNVFALKMKSENTNLILASENSEEVRRWIEFFNK